MAEFGGMSMFEPRGERRVQFDAPIHGQEEQKKYKMWETDVFTADMCEALVTRHSTNYGEYAPVLRTILEELLAKSLPDDLRTGVIQTIQGLQRSELIFRRRTQHLQWHIPFHLSRIVDEICKQLQQSVPGDVHFFPFECSSTSIAIVTHERQGFFTVGVINTEPTSTKYLYFSAERHPKILMQTVFEMKNVTKQRITSEAFWACDLLSQSAEDIVVYTHLLPWLGGKTHAELLEKCPQNFSTGTKAEFGNLWKSFIHGLKYVLRKTDVKEDQIKALRCLIKQKLLTAVKADLSTIESIQHSTRLILRAAVQNASMNLTRNGKFLTEPDFLATKKVIDDVDKEIQKLPCPDDSTTQPPPKLNMAEGWDKVKYPDLFPFCETFRRLENVDDFIGTAVEQPRYVPVNFFRIPTRVSSFDEALFVIDEVVLLCIRITTQTSVVKNAGFLICSMMTQVFGDTLPVPLGPKTVKNRRCIWNTNILYGQQLQLMKRLWQCCEYFLWASFTPKTTKEFDAQRIIVLGAIASIGDAVMRLIASDHPSIISQHLRGYKRKPAFGILCGKFATQTENCVIVYPQLLTARAAILDYHAEISEDIPNANVMWNWEEGWAFCKATQAFIRQVCIVEGFNTSNVMTYFAMERNGSKCILGKYWEEYRYHRDLYIAFKWMMAPKPKLPTCQQCLVCKTQSPFVEADYGNHKLQVRYMHKEVHAKALQLRWPSFAIPSKFTTPFEAQCEDDILHIKNLPTFDDVMGQRDSELLLSYLTAPYVRIPLVLNFFATEDRVSCLQNTTIKNLLEGVLFEPAKFLPRSLSEKTPAHVPAEDGNLVATPYGVLLNELQFSPMGVVTPVLRLMRLAREMDAGTVHNTSVVDIILFLVRIVSRIQSHLKYTLDLSEMKEPPRGICFSDESIQAVRKAFTDLDDMIRSSFVNMIEAWVNEVMAHVVESAEDSADIDDATRTAAQLHSHVLLLLRNVPVNQFDENLCSLCLSSAVFLTTRHTWNNESLSVPETEIFDVLQIHRRILVDWMYKSAVKKMSGVMDSVVRVATSTGTRVEGHPYSWGYVVGEDCVGRFTRVDADTVKRDGFDSKTPWLMKSLEKYFQMTNKASDAVCINEGLQDVEINLHIFSLTFKAAHLVALPSEIAYMEDVRTIFAPKLGNNEALLRSMQCAIIQDAEHRRWVRLVGQEHDIQFWKTADLRVPLPADTMRFYPDDLTPNEEWIYKIVEPIRRAFFIRSFWQPPIFLLLPEQKLTSDQCSVILSAVCSKSGKKLKEIIAFRDHNCCHVYEMFSIGRRFYRSLIFTSDCHYTLHEMQPDIADRRNPWASWQRHAAGTVDPDTVSEEEQTVVVLRHPTHPDNKSKSVETFIPSRILRGLIPDAVLETHLFWQDPDDNLRGYPKDQNAMHILWVHWKEIEQTQIGADAKQICLRLIRFSRARSAPKVSEQALLKSQKLTLQDPTEEELDRMRTATSSEGLLDETDEDREAAANQTEGMFRDPTTVYQPKVESATIEDYNLLLVNLLYTPTGSPLHSVAHVFARLELLSHVVCWTTQIDYDSAKGGAVTLDLIHLPRLKLSFSARADADGTVRIWSLDHAHLFVSNLRPDLVVELLQGIPHSIILSDINDSISILVPALEVIRPSITNAPFSTELVINRENQIWYKKLDTRYYLYPVHVSMSFLFTPTLASALYLLGLRYLHCEYAEVFKLASTIGTDVEFTPEEIQNFDLLRFSDERPEAHACRSKVGLLVADSPVTLSWFLPKSVARMTCCHNSIGLSCRLNESEERRLLQIALMLLKKMELIHEVTRKKEVKEETIDSIVSRLTNKFPLFDGTVSERKAIKNFYEYIRVKFRDNLDVRITQAEISRLLKIWNIYRRWSEFPDFLHYILKNRSAFLEAEHKSLETGKPEEAHFEVPPIGKDEYWNFYKDYNVMTVKIPDSQQKLKNDENRNVKLSEIYDYFYCGTQCRKANMCKCRDCGEECGPDVGCPCPSCERFNKANLHKLRYLPPHDTMPQSSSRLVSFFDVFGWIESLFSEDMSSRSNEEFVQPEIRQFSSRLRKLTMRDDMNGFLRYYECLTGTTKVRIGSGDSAKDLCFLLFPLCHEARKPESAFGHLMHWLLNNPQAWNKLPKYNRTSKSTFESRMNSIYNGIISQGAQMNRIPADPPFVPLRTNKFTVMITPRPSTRTNPETPICETRVLPILTNTDCDKRVWLPTNVDQLRVEGKESVNTSEEIRKQLRTQPLMGVVPSDFVVFVQRKEPIDSKLAFDLRKHEAAATSVAKSMIGRIEKDMEDFATAENTAKAPKLFGMTTDHAVRSMIHDGGSLLRAFVDKLQDLHKSLCKLRDEDSSFVTDAFIVIDRTANAMVLPKDGTVSQMAAWLMQLRRTAKQEATLSLSYLLSCLTSNTAEEEWRQLNPFLTKETCNALVSLIVTSVLRANRVGHTNRAAESCKELISLLQKADQHHDSMDEAALHNLRDALTASTCQKADSLAGMLATKRVYIDEDYSYDPRFLIFEFTWNIVLRSRQRVLIQEMHKSILQDTSIVKQMIMGAGKTTVVGPLLALMLADSKNLVIQVVPPALLDFTRSILRATFSCVIQKQIFCFICDRATEVDSEVLSKFMHAKHSRGIVVTTPSSIKSIFLKYVEALDRIEDKSRAPLAGLEHEANDLGKVLKLWTDDAILIMDEVDLLLHPLKSELNFPIGAKHDIDFSPTRWKLPIHLIDALFYFHTRRISVTMKDSPDAHKLLRDIATVLQKGLATNALQATPHLTLLNLEFYVKEMMPVMAKWLMLFLKAHHFSGLSDEDTMDYVMHRPSKEKNKRLNELVEALEPDHVKTLNLSYEWITSFLPHVMQKIDRVSFGIMNADDMKRAKEEHPNMPRSRFVTSIPFIGKDLPSQSSEFAHPDVVIGLTILAYRYEGLRMTDFTDIMRVVHAAVEKEVGRFHQRKTNVMYTKWVQSAGGRILQSFAYGEKKKEQEDEMGMQPSESFCVSHTLSQDDLDEAGKPKKGSGDVLPLKLMKQANQDETKKLFKLFRRCAEVIHWYLCETIFPEYMRHQRSKLSASGQELGGNIMFRRRIGFSGTPSDLLPSELGKCEYEPGTDGKLIYTLTSPHVMSYSIAEPGWTVRSLLDWIAKSQPPFHALIDTGALITGMSNLQVAQYLLKHGLTQMEGVVFLDEADRKMILVRATLRVLKLAECGIPKVKRFAFYDQVHTTGMDIEHTPNAMAVQTLGKDMTFRDFSQGAYRMRGIAQGQTVHLLIIPEVYDLINRILLSMRRKDETEKKNVLTDVTAWLLVNSVRSEHTQHNQLMIQSVCNVWRKAAFSQMMTCADQGQFKVGTDVPKEAVAALQVYREPVDYQVPKDVPQPHMFSEMIAQRVSERQEFIRGGEGKTVVQAIMDQTKREDEIDNPVIDVQMVQEQEEEREQSETKEKEQEIEMEKFVDLAYSRDEEVANNWAFNSLRDFSRATQFYKLCSFKLYKRKEIAFPENVMLSRNYFNPKWSGHRRMKNVIVTMEWIPQLSELKIAEAPSRDYGEVPKEVALAALSNTVKFLTEHQGSFNKQLIEDFVNIALAHPESTPEDWQVLKDVQHEETVHRLLGSNFLRSEEHGRYTVALSLSEAETVRRIIHSRILSKQPLIPDASTALCLNIVPAANIVLDQTADFKEAKHMYQRMRAFQCLRFFDSDLHYTEQDINILLRSLHVTAEKSRQAFFLQVLACRRRARQRWEKTPVSLLFNLPTPYTLLHQRAIGLCLRREIEAKDLHLGDAFLAINHSHSGQLSADEVWGAFRFCRLLNRTVDDVLDFVQVADQHHDGTIHYPDFLSMLTGSREIDDDDDKGGVPTKDDMQAKKLPGVEPFGGKELIARKSEREKRRGQLEEEANKEMESEDKRVRQEIEQEQMNEELQLIQTCENPRLDESSLHFDLEGKDIPKLSQFFGTILPRQFEEEGGPLFFTIGEAARMNLMTRSIKLLNKGKDGKPSPFLDTYMLTCEFCLPKPKTASGKESKMPLLRMLDGDGVPLTLFSFKTNCWELQKPTRSANVDNALAMPEEEEEEPEYDSYPEDYSDYEDEEEHAVYVYSTADKDKKNRIAKMRIGDTVTEMIGERLSASAGSVSLEWMKISAPMEGWVVFDEGGKQHFKRENVDFRLCQNGTIDVVTRGGDGVGQLPPTVFLEEKANEEEDDSDDEFWNDWRFANDWENEDDMEEEEEEQEDFDMGDLTDLVAALKKAKELKVGDKVSRNPECWENRGNEDGGEGTVGKVVKVEDATVSVQWPNGNKQQYCWGSQGKFELIKVASADDDDDLGREVVLDDQHSQLLKKKGSKTKCSQCGQNCTLEQGWFKCNQCTYNLCKKCFKAMEHAQHEFTDMAALSEALKSSEIVRGSTVRIKQEVKTPANGWGDAPRDGSPGVVFDLDDEQGSVTVNFNEEPWHGLLTEVEVVHPKWELYQQSWIGVVFNVSNKDKNTLPATAAVIDQSFVLQDIKGKFKVGDRVKAKWRGNKAFPGTIRAVLPKSKYAVDFDDGDHEPKEAEDQIQLFPYQKGTKVRLRADINKELKRGMIAEVYTTQAYSNWKMRVRVVVHQGMRKRYHYIFDDQLEVLGTGKWFCRKQNDESKVPLPNSSSVILERSFTEGIVPKSVVISGREYHVDFDKMQLVNIKTKETLTIIREPEEPFQKKREELNFDDGKWHVVSLLIEGNKDIQGLCDGKIIPVAYYGPNEDDQHSDDEAEEDEEEEEAEELDVKNPPKVKKPAYGSLEDTPATDVDGKKKEKEEEKKESNDEYTNRVDLPNILDVMSREILNAQDKDPLTTMITVLEAKKDELKKEAEARIAKKKEEEGKGKDGKNKASKKKKEEGDEEDEEWEDIDEEDEDEEKEEADGEKKPPTQNQEKAGKKEDEDEGEEEEEEEEDKEPLGGWEASKDDVPTMLPTTGGGENLTEELTMEGKADSEISDSALKWVKPLKRTAEHVLTVDVRNPISVLPYDNASSSHRGKYGVSFPVRRVAKVHFNWHGEAKPDKAQSLFKEADERKLWICQGQDCGNKNSRLLDVCPKCGKDRVEVGSEEGKKAKIRAVMPKSREAQEVRKKMHAKLRSKYQQQLDALEDYNMVL